MITPEKIRNIAIIAHVDHGKTTLVDQLLKQSETLDARKAVPDRVMDSNDLERERGITIHAKNTAITWQDYQINIVDTPGHADFGGEVERILSMVDSVLLLVDAVDGPMPQTRFVTQKAFAQGLNPIVVINKIDRDGARPDWVIDQIFDLFDNLGASDEQLDFTVVYASAINGTASLSLDEQEESLSSLFKVITEQVPAPNVDQEAPLQMQISALDYSSYVGVIGIGRVTQGQLTKNKPVVITKADGSTTKAKVLEIFRYIGLDRQGMETAGAGDIVGVTGLEGVEISDTVCAPDHVNALPRLSVDEPMITMTFQVNDSPFAGQDGQYITSRKIHERLETELLHNVALQVENTDSPDKFKVSGRGELHLSVLLETMRREGYEIAVSRPEVVTKEVDGVMMEPYEQLTLDLEEAYQGDVMEVLGKRKGELKDMVPDGKGRIRLDYMIPAKSLIGFQNDYLTMTKGTGLIYHTFDKYGPACEFVSNQRHNGALIANADGKSIAFALFNLQERGKLLIAPGEAVYEGMVVGLHSRDNDLTVNPLKSKKLTNMRASGSDENIILVPPIELTIEKALSLITQDELVELTPNHIRIRKKKLKEHERKRDSKAPA